MTNPIERAMEAINRAVTVTPEDLEQLPQRFASGGYIGGSPVPIAIHPDECFITGADVRAGRLVCFRAGHPTPTTACNPNPRGEH